MGSGRIGQLNPDLAWRSILQDGDWLFKTGIGGMLNAGSGLLLAYTIAYNALLLFPLSLALAALVNGYMLQLIRYKTIGAESGLPPWENWLELVLSGLAWMAVQCLFWLMVGGLFLVFLLLAKLGGALDSPSHFLIWGVLLSLTFTIVLGLGGFFSFYLMVNFALEERTAAGFALDKVWSQAGYNRANFFLAWLLGTGVLMAGVLVPLASIIGIFLIPSSSFIAQAISVSLAAQVWGNQVDCQVDS